MIIDSPIVSSSYSGVGPFQQNGNASITGSLAVTGPIFGNLTGSATSASFAATAVSSSFTTTAATASSADNFTLRNTLTATGSNSLPIVLSTSGTNVGSQVQFSNSYATAYFGLSADFRGDILFYIAGSGAGTDKGFKLVTNDITRMYVTNTGRFLYNNATDDGSTILQVSGSGRFTDNLIVSNRVGIGTTSPQRRLHVVSSIMLSSANAAQEFLIGDDNVRYFSLQTPSGAANLQFNVYGGSNIMTLTNTGNVGIGTTNPGRILSISQTNPYISLTSTSNSREYLVGVDSNGWVVYDNTAAAYRMALDFSGNLGIGTTSPLSLLHVRGSSTGAVQAYIHNTDGSTNSSAELVFGTWSGAIPTGNGNPGPSAKIAAINTFRNDARTDLTFWTYQSTGVSTERMRITSAGNVGIGTTSPAGPLQVVGTADQIRSGNGTVTSFLGGSFSLGYTGTLTNHDFSIYTNSTEKMRITSGGNVGIGTTSPNPIGTGYASLDIRGAGGGGIVMGTTSTPHGFIYSEFSGLYIQANGASTPTVFLTNGAERMRITSSGNVGIGTASPGRKLVVAVSPTSASDDGIDINNGTNSFLLARTGASYTYRGVPANAGMLYLSPGSDMALLADGGNMRFFNDGGERMRISTGGNVGIGTTSPSYTLSVNGTASATDLRLGRTVTYAFTTNSSWMNAWTTVISPGQLLAWRVYLVYIFWDGNNQPYYVNTSLLFMPSNTNGSSIDNEYTPLVTTHTGGTSTVVKFRAIAGSTPNTSGLQIFLNSFLQPNGTMRVYVTQLTESI